jgi:hypothetical protein
MKILLIGYKLACWQSCILQLKDQEFFINSVKEFTRKSRWRQSNPQHVLHKKSLTAARVFMGSKEDMNLFPPTQFPRFSPRFSNISQTPTMFSQTP